MDEKYFAVKLLPSRPSFAQDLTDGERAVMQQHSAYWRSMMTEEKVLVFGPVLDPAGAYGFGIIIAADEDEVRTFMAGDPATQIMKYEFYQILAVVKE
jgi:uncharacterized protein YciI